MSHARKTDHPATKYLRGILYLVDSAKGKLSPEILKQIRDHTVNALDVINTNDPLTEKIATVLLVLRQCTSVDTKTIRGKSVTKTTIHDQNGYNWAMDQIHQLGRAGT